MAFDSVQLQHGSRGPEVVELQLRLAGFRGTTWDGIFGGERQLQVETFQRLFMSATQPSGVVDDATITAINVFAEKYSIDFAPIRCQCGECGSFGKDQFGGVYRAGMPEIEAYHHREYPGIHKAILHSYRALCMCAELNGLPAPFMTSGYRCWIHNKAKGRRSTNHMGKALDIDFPLGVGEDKQDDCNRCDDVRGMLVEMGNFQLGWGAKNRKALEPSYIAPSWIHMDVRCYEKKFLADAFFVKSAEELDA